MVKTNYLLNILSTFLLISYILVTNLDSVKRALVELYGNKQILFILFMLLPAISLIISFISIIYFRRTKHWYISLIIFALSIVLLSIKTIVI